MNITSSSQFRKMFEFLPTLMVACSLSSYANESIWVPPIGIPSPPFGITEQAPKRPDPWTSAVAGFYYVDASNPSSTDTSNPYGTPSKPRKTIPGTVGAPLPAGSVVEVHGRYTTAETDMCAAGTEANPVFIRGMDAEARPVFTQWLAIVNSTYLIVENLKFEDEDGDLSGGSTGKFGVGDANGLGYASHHIAFRHCEVSGNMLRGGTSIGAAKPEISYIVYYNNYIHDTGDVTASFDQDCHSIGVSGNTHHIWIVDNELARSSGDGVQLTSSTKDQIHHIYIGRNLSHGHLQNGLWTKTSSDAIFSQNICHSNKKGGLGLQYGPLRTWMIFNHSYNNAMGITCHSNIGDNTGSVYIIGNVINNIHDSVEYVNAGGSSHAAIMLWGQDSRYVINNTIHDVSAGIYSQNYKSTYIYNNIISNVTEPTGYHILFPQPETWELRNCLFYQNGSPARIKIGNTVYSLALLKSATSKGQGCLTADPLFINAAAGDFHLQAASPAVNSGIASSVYATFQDLYELSIAVDFAAKRERPQGLAHDMGAYEFSLKNPLRSLNVESMREGAK